MRRVLVMAGAGVALATALIVTLTTGASAAPLGPVSQAVTDADNALLVQARYVGRGHGYNYGYRSRGPSFGFYLGAPAHNGYTRSCWWSHRHHRRVCAY